MFRGAFAREQIFISSKFCAELKAFEKAILRGIHGQEKNMSKLELAQLCKDWWVTKDRLFKERLIREQA